MIKLSMVPKRFQHCNNLKKIYLVKVRSLTKPEPVKKVFVRKVDSPSSSVIASSNKPQQTETVKDPLTF